MSPAGRLLAWLLGLETLACLLFLWATPVGEAPDEPAHLYYVSHLSELAAGMAPEGPYGYEVHHPPLYYTLAFWWSRATGAELDYPLIRNPAYPESKKGGAFLRPPPSEKAARALAGVRRLRLLSLVLTLAGLAAGWRVALQTTGGDARLAMLAAAPFLLAPQLAFLGAVVSNDALTFALCAWALLLQHRVHQGAGLFPCLAAGLVTAAAPWAKASGFFLAATLLLAGSRLAARRDWRALAALWLPPLVAWSWWAAVRFEQLEKLRRSAGVLELGLWQSPDLLVRYPFFWAQAWLSYWAKPGWFQLRLPWPLYVFYLPASLLVAGGLWLAWRERARWRHSAAAFWTLALAANLFLLAAYLVAVDFQPQGRLLYPSLAAAIGLAAAALAGLHRRRPLPERLLRHGPAASLVIFFLLQMATVWVILADEGWPT